MTSDNRDYYQILGVPQDASFEDIRAAFRERAREFHPDRNPSPGATDQMQEVNEAYAVLRDEEQRAAYDRAHRTFSATQQELDRARDLAVAALGELAFSLGHSIAANVSNGWTKLKVGGEETPLGLWQATYEGAFEAALENDDYVLVETAGSVAAWRGANSEATRDALRHALLERASSRTEGVANDMAIQILGMLASQMGRQLGGLRTPERLNPMAWKDAYMAARFGVVAGMMKYTERLRYHATDDEHVFGAIAREAAESAYAALLPYVNVINQQRRVGRMPSSTRGSAPVEGPGAGCILNLIGTLIIGSILYGIFVLAGAICN